MSYKMKIGPYMSIYKHKTISDDDLSYYIGFETYKALYQLNPEIWGKISDFDRADAEFIELVSTVMISVPSKKGKIVKESLVRSFVNGVDSEPLTLPLIKTSHANFNLGTSTLKTSIYYSWIIIMVVSIILILNGIGAFYYLNFPVNKQKIYRMEEYY